MLKLAFVGVGSLGASHADALKEFEDVEIHSFFDPSDAASAAFSSKFGARRHSSLSELANDKSLDAVVVSNYSDQHCRTLAELIDAGVKRILCEKALVRHLDEGEDLLRRAAKAGALVFVDHQLRYRSEYAMLKKVIEDGQLGKVLMAKVAYCHAGYKRDWGGFFTDFERSGGVTLDMMSHFFDQLNWYFGEPESASARSLMLDSALAKPVDYVSATLTYKSGVICNVDGSWQRYGIPYNRLEVYGDKAAAILNEGTLQLSAADGQTIIELPPSGNPWAAFLEMAKTGKAPLCGLVEGFNAARVALGVIESAKSGQTCRF